MDVYKTERGKALVVVDVKLTKEQAKREANKHFHGKISDLKVSSGSVINEELYLEPRAKGKAVWVVSKK